jgi:hypothetical protein
MRLMAEDLPDPHQVHTFHLHKLSLERLPLMNGAMIIGGVEASSSLTLERGMFGFALKWLDADGMSGYLFPWEGKENLYRWREIVEGQMDDVSLPDDTQATPITLKILSAEERQHVLMALFERWEVLRTHYDELAARTRGLLRAFSDGGIDPPERLKAPARLIVARNLETSLQQWLTDGETDLYRSLLVLANEAKRLSLPQQESLQDLLSGAFQVRMRQLRERPDMDTLREIQEVVDLADQLDYTLDQPESVILIYEILTHDVPSLIERVLQAESREVSDLVAAILRLGERFGFSVGRLRQSLRPIEEQLAADPSLWP